MTDKLDADSFFEVPPSVDENEKSHIMTRRFFQIINNQTQVQISVMANAITEMSAKIEDTLSVMRIMEKSAAEDRAKNSEKFSRFESHHGDCEVDRAELFRRSTDILSEVNNIKHELPMFRLTSGWIMKLMLGAVSMLCIAVVALVIKL